MRMLTAARGTADFAPLVEALFAAMWERPRNLADPAVLATTLAAAGFDPEAWAAKAGDPDVKGRLVAATEDAVARGAFGAPTFFVGSEIFFGQDRLDWVEAAAA
jgi:2-hydroxychromene-2-carboxylate isomerase